MVVFMEPYEQEQWKELDQRLAEAEKKLLATANLVRAGIPMVVSQQMRIDALIDSDARLYLQMQQVDERLARLAESQQRTDETVGRLAESVQKLVDSMKSAGNGAH
jgi:predicted RNase H-like nuclease (RuvC/YqgF family)